jgi:hypothetical protein
VSAGLVAIPSATQATTFVQLSSILATASVIAHGASLMFALAWLALRRRNTISIGTLLTLTAAMLITWAAAGAHPNAPMWQVFAARLQDRITPLPASLLPHAVDYFIATLGPCVAFAVLLSRRRISTVVGAMVLALTAGTMVDMPAHALIMILASLATVLAAHDEHGMWEALMGKRLEKPEKVAELAAESVIDPKSYPHEIRQKK